MTRTPLAVPALLLAVALSACADDDPEPEFAPPESSSPTPTETETPSEPPQQLGPEETVRAWVEAQNLAIRTGKSDEVRRLGPNCPSCDSLVKPVEETYANGGHYETAGWRIITIKADTPSARSAKVTAAIRFARGRTIAKLGAEPVSYGPEKHIMVFELAASRDGWLVELVGFVP